MFSSSVDCVHVVLTLGHNELKEHIQVLFIFALVYRSIFSVSGIFTGSAPELM